MSRNATARAAERKPLPAAMAGIPTEALERAAHAASSPPAGNDEAPEPSMFFRALEAENHYSGANGESWRDGRLALRPAARLAQVDRALAGLSGLLEILHAAAQVQVEVASDIRPSAGLSASMVDRLHHAAGTLVTVAATAMDDLYEDLGARK